MPEARRGQKPKIFPKGPKIREEVFIGVMGITGAGKSSFIKLLTGLNVKTGSGMQSCTVEVDVYSFDHRELRIHLVDTPGFDDTDRQDAEVLRDIAGYLGMTYRNDVRLSGMIYLHRITDNKMQGSAKRNLSMFQKLCGEDCLPNIFLATTMWDIVNQWDAEEREAELIKTERFWGYMYRNGSKVVRHYNTTESAIAIIDEVIRHRKPVTLQIQDEMINQGLELDDTTAGYQLNQDIIKERNRHKSEITELQDEMRDALNRQDAAAASRVAELQDELETKVQESLIAQERLRIDLLSLQKEREAEILRLQKQFEEQAKSYETKAKLMEKKEEEIKQYQLEMDDRWTQRGEDIEKWQQEVFERRDAMDKRELELEILRKALQDTTTKLISKSTGTGFWNGVGEFLEGFCIGAWEGAKFLGTFGGLINWDD